MNRCVTEYRKRSIKLAKQNKFGLVFENHIPEFTPVYDIPVKRELWLRSKAATSRETDKLPKKSATILLTRIVAKSNKGGSKMDLLSSC